jgi:hypothetical protein
MNYQPVSNLAYLSKLIEKVVATQIHTYLSENDLLEPFQRALYSREHSTETALLRILSDVVCVIGEQRAALLVQLDVLAAFDTVHHTHLLYILKDLWIQDTLLMWFTSYLTNRAQIVKVKGAKSDATELDCDVPQGSSLSAQHLHSLIRGPFQNVLYHMYADDNTLYTGISLKGHSCRSNGVLLEAIFNLYGSASQQHSQNWGTSDFF